MRYTLAAVGSLKRRFYADACDFYTDRLRTITTVEVREVKEGADPHRRAGDAGEALLSQTQACHRVALDERGQHWTSEALAGRITELENRGISRLGLMIGGADGLGDIVRAKADEHWALSSMTFPHELARVVLLEQIYRAETIRAGHPYHRR